MPFVIVIALIVAGLMSASDKLGITIIQLVVAIAFGVLVCLLILRKLRHDAKQQAFAHRRSALMAKYNNDSLVDELMACVVLKGMPFDMLVDSIGAPVDEDHKVFKTKTRRTLKYGQTGVNRFDLRIIVEDDLVVGWQTQQAINTANGFRPALPGLPGAVYDNDVNIMQRKVPGPVTWIAWSAIGVVAFFAVGQIPPSTQAVSLSAQQQSVPQQPVASNQDASINVSHAQSGSPAATAASEPFGAGRDARVAFETWLKNLSAEQRRGALWWANERSKKAPRQCSGTGEYAFGCSEAKLRLDEADHQRLSDPEFRRGWNSVSPG